MNREQKAAAIAEIAANIDEAQAIFAVDYRGISVVQIACAMGERLVLPLQTNKNTRCS